MTDMKYKMLIDGQTVSSQACFNVINPSNEENIGSAPHCSETDCETAIDAANKAFRVWQGVDIIKRKAAMQRVLDTVKAHSDDLAKLLVLEQGKPLAAARGELIGVCMLLEKAIAIETPPEIYSDTDDRRVEVRRKPIGTIACITPWNFPLFCAVQKWAPAIVLGNTVIWKPSPYTPLAALRLAEMVKDILPAGVLNVVTGDDKSKFNVGAFLSNHPKVAKVSFTGSGRTGKSIMAACAPDVKRFNLELGGNDPAVVRSDCDVKKTAPKVFAGSFANSGQVCCAIKRCFVHESIFDEFKAELVKCAEAAKVGDGFDEDVHYGPLNNKMQLDKVKELVDDARSNGCEILCGGEPIDGPGYFYKPTIVSGIKEGVRLWDEEQFGPVLPITPYSDDDEAIERANNSEYGLGGSVWSSDTAAANDLASKILSGTVWVNQHTDLTGAPFGGFKQSGIGRELGNADVEAFTESQTLSLAKK